MIWKEKIVAQVPMLVAMLCMTLLAYQYNGELLYIASGMLVGIAGGYTIAKNKNTTATQA